jgi:muconate cycloisomerase
MRIVRITPSSFDAPFRFGYRSSHLLRQKADSILLAIHFDTGVVGHGESVPRSYVTGETPDSVMELLAGPFSDFLTGRDVNSLEDVEGFLDGLRGVCNRRGTRTFQSALGAVDIALLDGLGRKQGIPVHGLIGPRVRSELPWSLPIPLLSDAEIRKFHGTITRGTFGSLKVIVSRDADQNVERLRLVRSLFGESIEVRIDANGNWTREEAVSHLRRLQPYRLAAVEQPVAKGDMEGLRQIRKAFGIPVVVDESLCGPEDAEALIANEACDILNIKISKVGGLLAAKRIAAYGASKGVTCLLGSHVGETDILTNAALNFLLVAPALSLVEGFSSMLFGKAKGIDDLDPGRWIAQILDAPGIGFDPQSLKSATLAQ